MKKKNKTHYGKRWSRFCGYMMRRLGWTADSGPIPESKAIVLGVPHTSMADFIISYLYYTQYGEVCHVMIKKELFFWPLGPVLRALGCIPVDRTSGTALLRSLIEEMEKDEVFKLAIAPEGTRKRVERWKAGFHKIAREAGVPVYAGYFDWKTKHIGIGEKFPLTDDIPADMQRLYEHYRKLGLEGRHPERYNLSKQA